MYSAQGPELLRYAPAEQPMKMEMQAALRAAMSPGPQMGQPMDLSMTNLWATRAPDWPLGDSEFMSRVVNERRSEYKDWLNSKLAVADARRACTDVWALLVLVFGVCLLTVCIGFALFFGDPRRLETEADYHGRLCGLDPLVHHAKLLYWPRPQSLAAPICVGTCPSAADVVNSRMAKVAVTGPLQLAVSDGARTITISQIVGLSEVPVYPTSATFGRFCLPPPHVKLLEQLTATQTPVSQSADDALLRPLTRTVGASAPQLRRQLGDLHFTTSVLAVTAALVTFCAVFGASGAAVFLLSTAPRFTMYVSIAGSVFCSGAIGCALIVHGVGISDDYQNRYKIKTVANLQPYFIYLAGGLCIMLCLAMMPFACFFRLPLRRAAYFVSATLSLISHENALPCCWWLLIPGLSASLQLIGLWSWYVLVFWCASIATLHWPRELAESPTIFSNKTSTAVQQWGSDSIMVGGVGLPAVFGMYRHLDFLNAASALLLFSISLALRFWLSLIDTLARFIISVMVGQWYFIQAKDVDGRRRKPSDAWCRSLTAALYYHLGTLVSHAGFRTIFPFPVGGVHAFAVLVKGAWAPWQSLVRSERGREDADDIGEPHGSCPQLCEDLAIRLGPAVLCCLAVRGSRGRGMMPREWTTGASAAITCAIPVVQCLLGESALVSNILVMPLVLLCIPLGCFLSFNAPLPATRLITGLLLAAAAYIVSMSWAPIYEVVPDALLFYFAVDDAGHRSWRDVADCGDCELCLLPKPAVTADTSYALWSSLYTPGEFRRFLFKANEKVDQRRAERTVRR